MKELGFRYGKRLTNMIQRLDPSSEIHVQTVDSPRTKESAEKYLAGMLGAYDQLRINFNEESEDFLLEYFHVCQKLIKVIINLYLTLIVRDRGKFLLEK
jgi:hypothetical protein